MKSIIAVTMGDPGGVGPEIILKSLKSFKNNNLLTIGSLSVFEFASKTLRIPFHPNESNFLDITKEAKSLYRKKFGKGVTSETISIGKVSKWNAALTYAALNKAAELANQKKVQAIVTAPIQKMAMRLIDPKFLGHTEFLAYKSHTKEFAMMFVSERLRVTLVTIHLPINRIASELKTSEIVSKIRLTHEFLKSKLKMKNPKIGVSALNPHGSEFGTEEEKIIIPAIKIARKKGMNVSGPFPGDQIFHEAYQGRLDAVISMYHDQGLAPFKMIAFDEGVNVTIGLPYLRTSPDHGTACNIAYQNKANHVALLNSIKLAEKIVG